MNSHLLTRTYLVGERLTLADICVAMTLLHMYQYILEPELRKPYQNVNRWFQTVIYQPESIAVIGAFKLADKTVEYDAKKYSETQGKVSESEIYVYACKYKNNILNSLLFYIDFKKRKEGERIQEGAKRTQGIEEGVQDFRGKGSSGRRRS